MSAKDFGAWAIPQLRLELGGKTYMVDPPSVAAGGKLLAAAAKGEAVLRGNGEVPEEVQAVLDSIEPGEHPALGATVYAQLVADGVTQATIDRMSYYATFYWARGEDYADAIAKLLWAPRALPDATPGEPAPKD